MALAELFEACWRDADLKARFMSDPRTVMEERGIDLFIPEDREIKVVENTDDCIHVTLPARPEGHRELTDDDLAGAAGGCGACGVSALPWSG